MTDPVDILIVIIVTIIYFPNKAQRNAADATEAESNGIKAFTVYWWGETKEEYKI